MKPSTRALACLSLLLGFALLPGCGKDSGTDRSAQGEAAQTPTGKAAGSAVLPDSYDVVLNAECGERGFLGTYDVQVRDGRVTRAVPRAAQGYRVSLDQVPTLAEMLRMPSELPSAEVDLKVDPAGVPTSIMIDHDPAAIDDEECYQVSGFRPVG